jgi:hypothetical protein
MHCGLSMLNMEYTLSNHRLKSKVILKHHKLYAKSSTIYSI